MSEHSFLEHPNEEAPMLLEDLLEVQIQSSTAPYPGSEKNLASPKDNRNGTFEKVPRSPLTKNVFRDHYIRCASTYPKQS